MDVKGIDPYGQQAQKSISPAKEEPAVAAADRFSERPESLQEKKKEGTDEAPLSEIEQKQRMARLQDTLRNHNIEISYNDEVNRYAIKVLDAESKEVVKEIPTEKTLEMFAKMLELEGLLVDEKR